MSEAAVNRVKLIEEPEMVAPAAAPVAVTPIRRFNIPDIDRHGLWLLPRLRQTYPHLNDRAILGWIRNLMYANDFLFLYHDVGVALAQVISSHTLSPKPIVEERFVWVQDRENKEHVAIAAGFYDEIARWAKQQSAEVVVVEEMSDVPHEAIKERLGRIFTRQIQFARV